MMRACEHNCIGWAYIPDGLPVSDHHKNCPNYKALRFVTVARDGFGCVMTPKDASLFLEHVDEPEAYARTNIFMTQDQFDSLSKLQGY